MAEKHLPAGRLVAVDGSRGKDVSAAADALAADLRRRGVDCVISRWDASGLFGELAQGGRPGQHVSPRTLSLMYAADLAFRLRWEINAALNTGGVVVAAPYLETAIAFGAACGLPDTWLRELLRFAPAPHVRGLARERKIERGWKARLDRGYPEYATALFEGGAHGFRGRRARKAMIAALDADQGKKVFELTAKGIEEAAKAVINSRPAGLSRPASRPRTARR